MLVLRAYADPTTFEPTKIHRAQAAARAARLETETSGDRAAGERPQTHVLPDKALRNPGRGTADRNRTARTRRLAATRHASPATRPPHLRGWAFSHIRAHRRGCRESRAPQALPPAISPSRARA